MFQAVYTAARLGIADELAVGSKSAEELAGAVNAPVSSLYRLLRALGVSMLLIGGKERTEVEFSSLLASASFAVERLIPVGSVFDLTIFEARPV